MACDSRDRQGSEGGLDACRFWASGGRRGAHILSLCRPAPGAGVVLGACVRCLSQSTGRAGARVPGPARRSCPSVPLDEGTVSMLSSGHRSEPLCGWPGRVWLQGCGCGLWEEVAIQPCALETGSPPAERSAACPHTGCRHLGPGFRPAASPGSLECLACLARCLAGFGQSWPVWGRACGLSESPLPPTPSPRARSPHAKPGGMGQEGKPGAHELRQLDPGPAPGSAGWPLTNHSASKHRPRAGQCWLQSMG